MDSNKPTPRDVAKLMLEKIMDEGYLYQDTAVGYIQSKFGHDQFIYMNSNGNPAISKDVLKIFRELTEGKVVWVRYFRQWRLRKEDEEPNKRQVEY